MRSSEQIDEYIFLYYKKELTPEQRQELRDWLAASPDNQVRFRKMLKVYRQMDALHRPEYLAQVEGRIWDRLQSKIRRRVWQRIFMKATAAAAVVVLGVGLLLWQGRDGRDLSIGQPVARYDAGSAKAILHLASGKEIPLTMEKNREVVELEGVTIRQDTFGHLRVENETTEPEEQVTLHTLSVPEGGEYQIMLADGTKVWLNSATELVFPSRFGDGQREVTLKGEAYFEVKADPGRPFIVATDRATVKVLGTAFNVESYENTATIQVALLRGSVAFSATGDAVVLKPGEIADLNRRDGRTTVRQGDVEAIIAWTQGRFNFDNMPLEELLPRLERWYGVKFVFDDDACRQFRYTGAVTKYRQLNYVLDMISSMAMVSFREQDGKIHVREVHLR